MSTDPTVIQNATREELTVPLDTLYLDPNNPRFADRGESPVPAQEVTSARVQERTLQMLLGERRDGSDDLVESLRTMGWLPVDEVLVRAMEPGRYLVLDGNRRVAALKHLRREYDSTLPGLRDVGRLDPHLFDAVPVVKLSGGDPARELLLTGLKHVGGPRPWPPLDQARWLQSMQTEHGMTTRDLARSAGMSAVAVTLLLRAAQLADLFRGSAGGSAVSAQRFQLFHELVRSAEVMAWLGWRDEGGPRRQENLQRLFRWLSPTTASSEEEDTSVSEAPLTRRADIRELVLLLDDPKALAELDRTRSLRRALAISTVYAAHMAEEALAVGEASLQRLASLSSSLEGEQVRRLVALSSVLRGAVDVAQRGLPLTVQEADAWLPPFNPSVSAHFSEVTVARYRGLRDVALPSLRRINVLAGINNSGKTTLLEAVHLLAHQHDVTGALEVVRRRGRVESRVDPRWLVEQIPRTARLSGRFDAVSANETSVALDFARRPDVEDAAFYLGTLTLKATYGGRPQHSETLFYENRDRSTRNHGRNVLCRSALQSPFSLQDPSLLEQAYARSVERQTRDRIVSFLRDHVDGELVSIDLVNRFQRFLVNHRSLEAPLDLTHFGDGMQRIFLMCLLVAFVENGVLLLDEFENAIHASLLPSLARFVHELAKEFEVQVFLTTHSGEAIESLVGADLGEAVSAYALVRGDGGITARHFPGTTLAELIDFADFDLRSVK